MRWPWKQPHVDTDAGRRARVQAEQHLEQERARRPEVEQLARVMRIERQRNHFGDMWRDAAQRVTGEGHQ